MGDEEKSPPKEILTQLCPDCSQSLESDENKLKRDRLLREHRRQCESYRSSVMNNSRLRNLRSHQSAQEKSKLPAKRARDEAVINEMRARRRENNAKFYGDTRTYLDFNINLEESRKNGNTTFKKNQNCPSINEVLSMEQRSSPNSTPPAIPSQSSRISISPEPRTASTPQSRISPVSRQRRSPSLQLRLSLSPEPTTSTASQSPRISPIPEPRFSPTPMTISTPMLAARNASM